MCAGHDLQQELYKSDLVAQLLQEPEDLAVISVWLIDVDSLKCCVEHDSPIEPGRSFGRSVAAARPFGDSSGISAVIIFWCCLLFSPHGGKAG